MGIQEKAVEGKWVYDSSNVPVTFSDWITIRGFAPEPNDHLEDEDCVMKWVNHAEVSGWNDEACYKEHPFVCEY